MQLSDESGTSGAAITKVETGLFTTALCVTGAAFLAYVFFVTRTGAALPHELFGVFALIPGLTGLANFIVTRRQRMAEKPSERPYLPKFPDALSAAAVLTGVFLIAANIRVPNPQLDGLVYAGYGAYISTLWFMLVRLNANALSPRFMLNSALKASIAMLIGFVASQTGLFAVDQKIVTPTLYFLIGVGHAWAIKALRKTAMATFGVTPVTTADLSVRLLEGVDEGAADVLEELGITSVQHLATMHAQEVCGRSLYPRNRVLDWIDQAILVLHVNGRIHELRAIGIRSAYALVTIESDSHADCDVDIPPLREPKTLEEGATQRFAEAAQRLGLSPGVLRLVADCIRSDPAYRALERDYPERHPRRKPVAPDRPTGGVMEGEGGPQVPITGGQRSQPRT